MLSTTYMRNVARLSSLFCLLFAASAWAQVDRGTITGTVTDSTGAVVQGTEVTVRNTATGVEYRGVTDNAGVYSIPNLPVGHYDVHFNEAGFKTVDRTNLE